MRAAEFPAMPPIGWRLTLIYSIGALASAAKAAPMTTLLLLFYNQVVGLPALTVSAILMASLVLDAAWDPLIGTLSDHWRSRLGRRLPFMYAAIVPTSVLFVMLWTPPIGASNTLVAAYFAMCLIGVRFFDTLFELPHAALVPELTRDYDARTRLFTARYIFEAIGGITVTALAYNVFMKANPDGSGGVLSVSGYGDFAAFTGVVILLAMMVCTVGLHRRLPVSAAPKPPRVTLRQALSEIAEVLKSRQLVILSLAVVFVSVGSGISSALNIYWLLYFYGFSQTQMTLLMLPVMAGMLLTMLTPWLAAKLGKRNAAIGLIWVYALGTLIPLLLRLADVVAAKSPLLLGLVAVQSALGVAAMTMTLIVFAAMISDLVEDAEVRTGRRSEGLLLAANSFVRKATQGLGTLGAGALLTVAGFPKGAERGSVSPQVLDELGWTYLFTSVALFAATTAILWFYRLDRAAHEANLRELLGRQT